MTPGMIAQDSHGSCGVTCRTCGLSVESWDDPALRALNSRKTIRTLPKGSVLFNDGDAVTTLYRLLSGVVLLRKGDSDGNSVITRMVLPLSTFGFRGLAGADCHRVSAETASEVTLCCIPVEAARLAFITNRSLERAFTQHLSAEMTYAEDAILGLMTLPVRERLLILLDQMASLFGHSESDGSVVVPLPVMRSDIASMVGIARETFSRCLRTIEVDGLLHFDGHSFRIPDPDRFHQVVATLHDNRT